MTRVKHSDHRPPESHPKTTFDSAKSKAVGIPAVFESFKHMLRYMDFPKAVKASLKMNQVNGFDCPGCAWPDPDNERSSIAEYCENGIKALAEEATKRKADPTFWEQNSIQEMSSWSDFKLGKSGRITHPMYLSENATHYTKISWEKAFNLISSRLNALESPDDAIFYTSGRTSNEAAFLYGAFVRAFGTNNLPDCSNMCHESSGTALSKTLGIGKGSVKLEDFDQADLVIVMGQNPGTNHPRMLTALEKCKDNGGKIVSINPLKEAGLLHYTNPQRPKRILQGGIPLSDLYLQVKVNGDLALLKYVIYQLTQKYKKGEDVFDREFIKQYTSGFEDFINDVEHTDIAKCLERCGLNKEDLDTLLNYIVQSKKIIICWAMGITQHINGVATIQEIVNLLLLKGSIGKTGAGTCPVRGHSNVQGDRTMGIWEKMKPNFHQKLGKEFGFESPVHHGYDVVQSIKAMNEKKGMVFFAMGGNFLSATPDTDHVAKGLKNCNLTVQVSTKPNRSHLITGKEALILPCLGRTEIDHQESGYQFVSVENSMGKVSSSKGILPPVSKELKSEIDIIAMLAHKTLNAKYPNIDWLSFKNDYNIIRSKIANVIKGFKNYNDRIRKEGGFYLPNPARERRFTSTGKALFTVNKIDYNTLENDQFLLTTIRAHDQYNTTIYGLNDRYRGIQNGRNIILMNMNDMEKLGLEQYQKVDISSHYKKTRTVYGFKAIPYDIPRGNVAAYFPEANPIVPIDLVARESNTPVSKSIKVKIEKSSD